MIPFNIIAAIDEKRGIGKNGKIPWIIHNDLKHFKDITARVKNKTKRNAVVMGRKTWESIPERYKPLKDRLNIVISTQQKLFLPKGVLAVKSLEQVFKLLNKNQIKNNIEEVFIIGGGQLFKEAIKSPQCQRIYLTKILSRFNCDTFFPAYDLDFALKTVSPRQKEGNFYYFFTEYIRIE